MKEELLQKDELLYKEEHTNCFLYDNAMEDSLLAIVEKTKGEKLEINERFNRIIFLLKGKVNFLYGSSYTALESGSFILLPRGCEYTLNLQEDSTFIIVHVHHNINFCEHFSLVMLHQLNKNFKNNLTTIHPLKINALIASYLQNIYTTHTAGLKCKFFHDLKQRELLYYLRAYYPKNELMYFFAPMLNENTDFVETIYQNYESAKSITDLADITHYSLSGFKKRFNKVFGMAPHTWIEKEKSKRIHHEINCTQKSFKEIALKYNFYSSSHFTRFCTKMYGMSPAILREKTRCAILSFGMAEDDAFSKNKCI